MGGGSRGKPKPTLRELSREHPSREESEAVRKTIVKTESPIAAAILGVAIIEREVETLIRRGLRRKDDQDTWKELTDDRGPLGTFSQKIVLGYAMGLYDGITRKNLDIVRRIRNAFAHSKRVIDFSHELVVKELAKISFPSSKFRKKYKEVEIKKEPREAYELLCFDLVGHLLKRQKRMLRATVRRRDATIDRLYARIAKMVSDGKRSLSDLDPKTREGLLERYPEYRTSRAKIGEH